MAWAGEGDGRGRIPRGPDPDPGAESHGNNHEESPWEDSLEKAPDPGSRLGSSPLNPSGNSPPHPLPSCSFPAGKPRQRMQEEHPGIPGKGGKRSRFPSAAVQQFPAWPGSISWEKPGGSSNSGNIPLNPCGSQSLWVMPPRISLEMLGFFCVWRAWKEFQPWNGSGVFPLFPPLIPNPIPSSKEPLVISMEMVLGFFFCGMGAGMSRGGGGRGSRPRSVPCS